MSTTIGAVITGDIVDSRRISTRDYDTVLYQLTATLELLADTYGLSFDIFRGDEFQLALKQPEHSLYVAALIRLALKSAKYSTRVRLSIAIGGISDLRDSVKSSTGDAFVRSGQTLDNMKSELLAFDSKDAVLKRHLGATIELFDAHLDGLTTTEAYVLFHYLQQPDTKHAELAEKVGKSRPNTTKLLNASHYSSVSRYLDYANELITEACNRL